MNKKFSTLVAGLLLAGGTIAPSFADTFEQVAATSGFESQYYYVYVNAGAAPVIGTNAVLDADADNMYSLEKDLSTLWTVEVVKKTVNGQETVVGYKLVNAKTSKPLSVKTKEDGKDVVYDTFTNNTGALQFVSTTGYKAYKGVNEGENPFASNDGNEYWCYNLQAAAPFALRADQLEGEFGDGESFSFTIGYEEGNNNVFKAYPSFEGGNVFEGQIYANAGTNGLELYKDAALTNRIVLTADKWEVTSSELSKGNKFAVLDEEAYGKAVTDKKIVADEFTINVPAVKGGKPVEVVAYVDGINDLEVVVAVVKNGDNENVNRLTVAANTTPSKAEYTKTASNGTANTFIVLGDNNIVNPADLLKKGYAVIKQLNDEGADDDLFVVAAGCGEEQAITVAETVENDLEKQWLVSYNKETKEYTLTNRENTGVTVSKSYASLRENGDEADNIYVYGEDEYEITFHDFDASSNYYKLLAEDAADLVDSTFVISYWSTVFNGYANVSANDDKVAFIGTEAAPVEFKAKAADKLVAKANYTYWTGSELKTEEAKLEVPVYTFASAEDNYFAEGTNGKYVVNNNAAQNIVIRKAGDHYNLMTVAEKAMSGKVYVGNNDSYMYDVTCMYADNKNTLFMVETNNRPEYRRFGATIEDGLTDVEGDLNVLKFFRTNDENTFLYENKMNRNAQNGEACLNFLGETNLADQPENAQLPFLVDTAYVRNKTRKPLYMLAVRSEFVEAGEKVIPCPIHPNGDCEHATTEATPEYRTGDYLVVLDDSTSCDQSKYQGNVRLAFVPAKHIADTLVIASSNGEEENWFANDSIIFSDNKGKQIDATPAAFAFRLVDPTAVDENKAEFIIENTDKDGKKRYVRVHNSVPVLVDNIEDAATFDVMAAGEGEEATENESISATGVSVVATEGAVIVKGAEGKKVVVTNVLGQTIANTVVTSSEATIAAPVGVVVVAVDGEAVKAIVK